MGNPGRITVDGARYRRALRGERLPLAFVDLDAFDRNVDYVARTQATTGKRVRIHSKSLRCVALVRRALVRGGDSFRGVMTFTVEESSFLAAAGLDDLLVAYPTVQPADLTALVEMTRAGTRVAAMVDCPEHLHALSAAGRAGGVTLRACLDVDVSYRPVGRRLHLGVRRSPVRTVADAERVAAAASGLSGVVVDGVMAYEAHVAGLADAVPGQRLRNALTAGLKRLSVAELSRRRGAIVRRLRGLGLPIETVNGGGSGSLPSSGDDPILTEVTAGSAFYAPALFHHFRQVTFQPAAFFALQVVRRSDPGFVTCHGGGYVASGAAGADRLPVPVYPAGLSLLPLEGAGEVQTPLALGAETPELALGDPVFFQHAKAGELPERFDELILLRGDAIVDRVSTYRGAGHSFL